MAGIKEILAIKKIKEGPSSSDQSRYSPIISDDLIYYFMCVQFTPAIMWTVQKVCLKATFRANDNALFSHL